MGWTAASGKGNGKRGQKKFDLLQGRCVSKAEMAWLDHVANASPAEKTWQVLRVCCLQITRVVGEAV